VGSCNKTSCALTLPANEPGTPQIEAEVSVPKSAPGGETIKFSATVSVPGNTLTATASAPTVTVAKPAAATSPTAKPATNSQATTGATSGSASAGSTATIPGVSGSTYSLATSLPIGNIPVVGSGVPGFSTTIPAGSASSLFPQINPSATPSPAPGAKAGSGKQGDPVADSSTIPLSLVSSEFGAQIVGLIILLLGVAIAVTRMSLRKARTTGKPGS
jgi:hypothetical protein